MAKVYCKDCIFFKEGEKIPFEFGPPDTVRDVCLSPNNYKDNYKEENVSPKSQPDKINKWNNCTWFEAIPDADSSSSSSSSSSSGE